MRMLIGTSFGKCLKSIADKEVSRHEVLVIIAGTQCPDLKSLLEVVDNYHLNIGNRAAYDLSQYDLGYLRDLATDLYQQGKIHQPRLWPNGLINLWISKDAWINLAPTPLNSDPRVVEAYEKYLVIRNLLQ